MLEEAPPQWSEIESFPDWKDLPTVKKTAIFQDWSNYSKTYAQEQGLWDEPDFQKDFQDRSKEVVNSINKSRGWGEWFTQGAVDSYHVVDNARKAFHRGWLEGDVATELSKPNPDLHKITDLQKTIADYGPSAEFNTAWDDKAAPKDSWEAFKKDPIGNFAQLIASSFGTQIKASVPALHKIPERAAQFGAAGTAAGVLAGGPGAPISGPAIGTAGFAMGVRQGLAEAQMAGSYAAEYGGDMIQSLQQAGVDVTNYDQMKAAFEDPAKIKEIKEHAMKKGVPVAVGDGLLGAVAGSIFPGSSLAKGPVKKVMSKIGQWAGEMLFQGAGSAGAEAASQVATEGKIYSPRSVIAEFAADVVSDVASVGVGHVAETLVHAKPEQQAKFAETAKTVNTLKEAQAPLTAQALVANTLKTTAAEDPNLISELLEERAPEGTFTDQGQGNERFAPRTKPIDETLEPVQEAEAAPAAGTEDAVEGVQGGVPAAVEVQPTLVPPPLPAQQQPITPLNEPTTTTGAVQPVQQPAFRSVNVAANVNPAIERAGSTPIPGPGPVATDISPVGVRPKPPAVVTTEQNAVPAAQVDEEAAFRPEPSPLNVQKPEVITAKERIAIQRIKKFLNVPTDVATDLFYHPDPKEGMLDVLTAEGVPAQAAAESPEHREAFTRTIEQSVDFINKQRESAPPSKINEQPAAEAVQPTATSQGPEGNVGLRPPELPREVQGVREQTPSGPAPTNEEQLNRLSGVTVSVPQGATFIRATDSKGRASVEPVKNVVKGLNPFHEAGPWVKVEAGTMDKKGNFVPADGPVTVQDRAQATLQKKVNGLAKNQQTKAKKALSTDTSPDPYQGAPLTDKGPLRPEQNIGLLGELSRIGALDDNATGQTVLEFLAQDKKSPVWVRTLAKLLAGIGAQNVEIETSYRPQSTWSALYVGRGETGKVMFNTAARNPGVAETILHEIAHHVTLSKIEGKVSLTTAEQSALDGLQKIFDTVSQMKEFEGEYGLNNLGEFVSETFSNAGFRAKLDNLTAEGEKVSIFQRVVNALARLLFNRTSPGSALEEAMRNAIDLAGAPVVETPISAVAYGQMREGNPLKAMMLNAYRSGWYKNEGNLNKLVEQFPQSREQITTAYGRGNRESRSLVAPMRPETNTVEVRAVNRKTKGLEPIQVEATTELQRTLKVYEGVFKGLIKCL